MLRSGVAVSECGRKWSSTSTVKRPVNASIPVDRLLALTRNE
jgi:hypothetical protein